MVFRSRNSEPVLLAPKNKLLLLPQPIDNSSVGPSLPLFLSLFLLLLAFFVVLNSLSPFEGARRANVVASIHAVFPKDAPQRLLRGVRHDDPLVGPEEARLAGVAAAFETVLGGESKLLIQTADRLVLDIAADQLFDAGSANLSPTGRDLVSQLIPLFNISEGQTPISVELLTGLQADKQLSVAQPRVRQAAALADALRAGGVSGRYLAIGAERAGSASIRFIFDISKRRTDA